MAVKETNKELFETMPVAKAVRIMAGDIKHKKDI